MPLLINAPEQRETGRGSLQALVSMVVEASFKGRVRWGAPWS